MRRKYQHRILIALLLLATPFYGLYSQTNSAEGEWETYSIPEVCSFAIPNTLEVRSNESFYGKFVKAMYQSSLFEMLCDDCDLFLDQYSIVLEPKGLNDSPKSDEYHKASQSYARIMLHFSYDEIIQEDIVELTESDLRELDQIWCNEIKREYDCLYENIPTSGQLKWYPLSKKSISGLQALVVKYDRPALEGGDTHVEIYKIFYDKKLLSITMSYKVKEENKYKADFEKFIQLFNIDTRKQPEKAQTIASTDGIFISSEYHFKFTYDKNKYKEVSKQMNNSHCFCKVQSYDEYNIILFSAWDVSDEDDESSVFDPDYIAMLKQADKDQSSDEMKLLTSCEKVKVGGEDALKTVYTKNMLGIMYRYTTYRVYHKGRLYTLDFYILGTDYNKDKNIINKLIEGIQFN